jgi:hypothetical protein
MSVFRVRLTNSRQGLLDIHDNQRTAYIMGPNRINRKLKDGESFTDCNYWKRFAYPNVPLEEAFIEVVEDDGTIYGDKVAENTYPRVYNLVASPGSTYSQNKADIAGDSGSWAIFAQITNKSETDDIKIRINGLNTAIIDIPAGATQTFNPGEVTIGTLEIDNGSGSQPAGVQILVSVSSVGRS